LEKSEGERRDEQFSKDDESRWGWVMAEKQTGNHGRGIDSNQASDLVDMRYGTFDPAGQKKADTSQPTAREKAQPGASMQGEPVPATPADGVDLPEGLKRQPVGPYSRAKGRGNNEVQDHVPEEQMSPRGDARSAKAKN